MDPFDWTMDKNIYQRWQLWSHKARLALDAMEGDTENNRSPTCIIGLMVMVSQDQGMEEQQDPHQSGGV